MSVDVSNIDLVHIEDVTDIKPKPTIAVKGRRHQFGHLGDVGKRLLQELLRSTDENTPFADRVFGRLGLTYQHVEWDGWDLYWVDGGAEAMVEALERWNSVHSM